MKDTTYQDWSDLLKLIASHNAKGVRSLISNNPELLNSREENFSPALHTAITTGTIDIAKILLDAKPGLVNTITRGHDETVLHTAARDDKIDMIRLFLNINPNLINIVGKWGDTVLHKASAYGSNKVVEFLIKELSLDVSAVNTNNYTALRTAVKHEQVETVKLLLQVHPSLLKDLSDNGDTVLHLALSSHYSGSKRREIAKLLLQEKPELLEVENNQGKTVITQVANIGNQGNIAWIFNYILSKHLPEALTGMIYDYLVNGEKQLIDNQDGIVALHDLGSGDDAPGVAIHLAGANTTSVEDNSSLEL